ncbi:MAG: DHH family phosphoesterase [Lachnospiraceae bacterium]|nr:DHH family phosphoesterase [Lachnospiraceae bacterium]
MSRNVGFKGQVRGYVLWPLLFSILLILFNVAIYFVDRRSGFITTVFVVIYITVALILYHKSRMLVLNEFVSFATKYGQVQRQLLRDLEVPYALLDESGRLIWTNESFEEKLGIRHDSKKSITSVIPAISRNQLPGMENETEIMINHDDHDYRVSMKKVSLVSIMSESEIVESFDYNSYIIALFMFDETIINRLQIENDEQKMSVALIYIDNFDEALSSIEEVRRSLLVALIDRKINKYMSSYDGLVKKLEKDKYLVLLKKKYLKDLCENRFELLEDVKTVNIGNEMSVTLSIGVGVEAGSYLKNYEYARNSIDLALGRGGDQAVVKTPDSITYYGGKSQMSEKNTRVKARVKAHALREIIEGADRVIVMGHKMPDVDAFGSAIGVFRAAKSFGKKVHIVVNEVTTSIRPLYESMVGSGEYDDDLILNSMQALEAVDQHTVLIVVDVNRPSRTECADLINRCKTIVVLDHHRQGSERIDNATLSYIEPYASSAAEMVAEILQYIGEDIKLKPIEADCLYSGMMVDTNNFMTKTGVRTFEAAAYLRRNGADVTRVRKLFRTDMEAYRARTDAVRNFEVFNDVFAISLFDGEGIDSPTVIGAQAANELLNINGIRASFVLTDYQNMIYISARSIDELNVQIVMERLGGGGHLNIAGAQLENMSLADARNLLMETLENMQKEGAI